MLILNFAHLRKHCNSIFLENRLGEEDRDMIFVPDARSLAEGIRRAISDAGFRTRLLEANQGSMAYFIG